MTPEAAAAAAPRPSGARALGQAWAAAGASQQRVASYLVVMSPMRKIKPEEVKESTPDPAASKKGNEDLYPTRPAVWASKINTHSLAWAQPMSPHAADVKAARRRHALEIDSYSRKGLRVLG